jgi:hypothetical protein
MLDRNTDPQNFRKLILLGWMLWPALCLAGPTSAPPAGRSLFDKIFAENLPVPFTKLVEQLRTQTSVKTAILPFSRSLQRKAGAPEFYRFPRVVAAVDGEWKGGLFDTRDKLFLGYNEKSDALEVISYNETAGRFEFQVVHDYSKPAKRRIVYANRNSCVACHQNQAPIFAIAPWDETEANTSVGVKLRGLHGPHYLGAQIRSSIDFVYDYDNVTDRANLLPVYQKVWKELCATERCRKTMLLEMLKLRMDRNVSLSLGALEAELGRRWRALWPKGMVIPDPNIPNRDPFEDGFDPMDVRAEFEPINPRGPLELVEFEPGAAASFFEGLAFFLTDSDAKAVAEAAGKKPERDRILNEAIAQIPAAALAPPFRRSRIMAALMQQFKKPYLVFDENKLPPVQVDTLSPVLAALEGNKYLKTFKRCAVCHDNQIGVPPNFLSGTPAEVKNKLAHCSERIFYRLNMWHLPEAGRGKTPMPPVVTLEMSEEDWQTSGELRAMENYIRGELKSPAPALAKRAFSSLRECLP